MTVYTSPDGSLTRECYALDVRHQSLRVVNGSDDFARYGVVPQPVTVTIAGYPPRVIAPGRSTIYAAPLRLGPGLHSVWLGPAPGCPLNGGAASACSGPNSPGGVIWAR